MKMILNLAGGGGGGIGGPGGKPNPVLQALAEFQGKAPLYLRFLYIILNDQSSLTHLKFFLSVRLFVLSSFNSSHPYRMIRICTQKTDNRQYTTQNRKRTTDNRQQTTTKKDEKATDNRKLPINIRNRQEATYSR